MFLHLLHRLYTDNFNANNFLVLFSCNVLINWFSKPTIQNATKLSWGRQCVPLVTWPILECWEDMGSILSHVVDLDFHPLDNNILCHCHYCISTILPTSSHSCTVIWHNMNKFRHWVSENQMVGFIFFIFSHDPPQNTKQLQVQKANYTVRRWDSGTLGLPSIKWGPGFLWRRMVQKIMEYNNSRS